MEQKQHTITLLCSLTKFKIIPKLLFCIFIFESFFVDLSINHEILFLYAPGIIVLIGSMKHQIILLHTRIMRLLMKGPSA